VFVPWSNNPSDNAQCLSKDLPALTYLIGAVLALANKSVVYQRTLHHVIKSVVDMDIANGTHAVAPKEFRIKRLPLGPVKDKGKEKGETA
jgi:hypothetical protein